MPAATSVLLSKDIPIVADVVACSTEDGPLESFLEPDLAADGVSCINVLLMRLRLGFRQRALISEEAAVSRGCWRGRGLRLLAVGMVPVTKPRLRVRPGCCSVDSLL